MGSVVIQAQVNLVKQPGYEQEALGQEQLVQEGRLFLLAVASGVLSVFFRLDSWGSP